MGAAGTKAKKTAKKVSPSPRSEATPDTRLTDVLDLLKHLSDPLCLRVLALADEMSGVAEIGAAGALDESAVRDHLAVLRNDRLVSLRRQGKQDVYSLTSRGLRVLAADLTDPRQQALLEVSAQKLTGNWDTDPPGEAPTQRLGTALFATRNVEGFLAISAELPLCKTRIVFPKKLRKGSELIFHDFITDTTHRIAPP